MVNNESRSFIGNAIFKVARPLAYLEINKRIEFILAASLKFLAHVIPNTLLGHFWARMQSRVACMLPVHARN